MNRERIMTDDTDLFYLKFICQVRLWAGTNTDFTDITDYFSCRCATADFADLDKLRIDN